MKSHDTISFKVVASLTGFIAVACLLYLDAMKREEVQPEEEKSVCLRTPSS